MLGRTVWSVKQGGIGDRPPGRAGAGRSLHFRRYRKFTEMRVMESFIAYSQGFSSFDKIILVPELPLALSLEHCPSRPPPTSLSGQSPSPAVSSTQVHFHFFCLQSNLHTTAGLLFLKYHLDCVTSQLKNLSVLSNVTGSSTDTSSCLTPSAMQCQQFTSKNTCPSQSGSTTDLSLYVTPFLETFLKCFS